MIYFCADDYGMSVESNMRIENCLKNGVLNKISVLPNGETENLKQLLSEENVTLSLHINLVEGRPVSKPADVDLLVSDRGYFKYSFVGLFLLSILTPKKELEKQLYREIQSQIRLWKTNIGEKTLVSIDSHQHTHMIPLVFKTLVRVIKDEGLMVESMRIPAEPILPYILTPSLYLSYTPKGLLKQWILKTLAFVNHREIKKIKTKSAYFMGVMFSGKVTEEKIKKVLPHYLKIAEKNNRNIEIALHPGYVKKGEKLICGSKESFRKFYYSSWRKAEYDTLINFKF